MQVKPTIILRSARGAKSRLPWAEDLAGSFVLPNIGVAFQPAWADGVFCIEEILLVAADLQAAAMVWKVRC